MFDPKVVLPAMVAVVLGLIVYDKWIKSRI